MPWSGDGDFQDEGLTDQRCRLFTFVLTDGGTAGLVWGYVAIVIGFMLVSSSLAEMASMAPTSAGQYHWVSEFAPRSGQKFLSFITGTVSFSSQSYGNLRT